MSNSKPAVRFAPQSAECDAAIAAIEAGLIASGAIEAHPHFTVIMRRGCMGIARRYQAATSDDAGAMALAECAPATIIRIMPSPAMVPQQVQQQQARDARHAQGILSPGCIPERKARDGRYRIALEWCGYAERRHVARFCGEWIGQAVTRDGAEALAAAHRAAFLASIAR